MSFQPFNLRSFEDEAQTIVSQARAKARDLLAAALAEQQKIRDQAYREGFEAGKLVGMGKGEEEERAQIRKSTSGLTQLLEGIAHGIESKRTELLVHAERDLVALSIAIAEKIVRAEVAAGRPVAKDSVKRAVELLVRRNEMDVKLNPKDLALIEAYVPELRKQFSEIARIELRPDEAVAPGGCVVVTHQGGVDADLKTQLEEIERSLLGDSPK